MALSTRKKNIIIADWKTGAYSKTELEKKHKITFKTLNKLIGGIMPTNAEAVKVLHEAAEVRKSIKSTVELKAIDNVVESRLKVDSLSLKLLNKIDAHIDKGKSQKAVSGKNGVDVVEVEHDSRDFKNLAEAIDKASVTLGVNERFSSSQIQIANNNEQKTNDIKIVVE